MNFKNKETLSLPGRCGWKPDRIHTVGWVETAQLETAPTNLECFINSKIYYKETLSLPGFLTAPTWSVSSILKYTIV